ncbi:MAG: fatty acid desaturase [Gemmatimonadaceae bacterium]
MSKRLLKRPEDIHCVVFQLLLVAGYVSAFWLYLHPDASGIHTTGQRIAFMAGAGLMLGWCSGINVGVNFHNHVHRPVFNAPWLNRWFGRFWTVSGGWPSMFWEHAHVTVHHADLLHDSDWTLPYRRRDGSWENPYWYAIASWPLRYTKHLFRDFTSGRGGPEIGRRALVELTLFVAIFAVPFFIDWQMAIGLWLFPAWVANAMVMGPGMYAQHADCEPETDEHPYRHSNTFVQRAFNLTMFNIGYHIEHHAHPTVHWSVLPDLHERLKQQMIDDDAHILPFGYYRAGQLLCQRTFSQRAAERWAVQHPDYIRRRAESESRVAPVHV